MSRPRRFLFLSLAAVVVGLAVGVWALMVWLRPESPINPETFAKLRAGMTEREVELAIGLPEGDYRASPVDVTGLGRLDYFGEVLGRHTTRWWHGDRYWIYVCFSDGRVVGAAVGWTFEQPESFFSLCRRWLGL